MISYRDSMQKKIQNLTQKSILNIGCGASCDCKCYSISYRENSNMYDIAAHQSELFTTKEDFLSSQLPFGRILGEHSIANSRQNCMNFCSSYLESFLSCEYINNS